MAVEPGQLGNLGFASTVLTQETINNMKKADEEARLSPYTEKIESNTTKQKDITELKTKLSTFQQAVSDLGDATVFAKRKVSSSVSENPPASLSASSGVSLQSMKVSVTQLAQKDVYQSKGFSNQTGYVNASLTSPATLTFFSNGKEYSVSVDSNTTYEDLVDRINEATDGNVVAKIVNTGEKGNPYRLTLSASETGEDYAISFFAGKKDAQGVYQQDQNSLDIFKNLGWELDTSATVDPAKDKKGYGIIDSTTDPLHIQTAQDANFTLDGIKMIRSSNTIDDIGVGLTLTLNKTGDVNFEVQQDSEAASEAMQKLADAYNDLISNLNAATDYNAETGTAGVLQGVSEVSSIRSQINAVLFKSQVVEGEVKNENDEKVSAKVMVSLQDYGLTLSDAGTLNFDSSKFSEKMKENPEFAESLFAGITEYEDINHTSNLIKENSLNQYLNPNGGTANGLEFEKNDFKITYNDEVYDLSKKADGTAFKLTGATEKEMMQNLVAHINDLKIDGLSVTLEEINKNGDKGFTLKFKGESGSDFEISGKDDVLKTFGLSSTKIVAEPKEALGIFAELKEVLKGINGADGSLTKYDEGLTEDTKSLEETKEKTQELIDTRYTAMEKQWLQYEMILSKLNSQLLAVQSMIEASNSANS